MEHYKQKTLPDHFKAVSKSKGTEYVCKKISEDIYMVAWGTESCNGCAGQTTYAESSLKEIIFENKAWVIVVESSADLLEAIKQFCKEGSVRAVLFNAAGFKVYSESITEPIFVATEDKLLDVMKAVTLIESCYGA